MNKRQRRTLLLTAVAGHGLKHLFYSAFYVLLPEIKAGLALSNTEAGILSTSRNLIGGITNLPAGFAADRFPRRRAEILGLSVGFIGIFALVLSVANSLWLAAVAAALIAISTSFWHPAAIGSLAQEFAARRGMAIGLHGTGGSVGETLGPLLIGALILAFGWRLALQSTAIPAVGCGVLIWLLLRSVPTGEASVVNAGAYLRSVGRLVIGNRRLMLVLLFAGGYSAGQASILTFLPIYLREGLLYSSVTVGLYLSLAQVAGIGAQPLMGYLSDRFGVGAVLVPSLAVLGVACLTLSVAPAGWPFTVVVFFMGAFLFSIMAILLASAVDLVQKEVQAVTVSLVFGASVVASSFSPAIAGVLGDAFGVKAAFIWASGIVLAAALLAGVTRWQRQDAVLDPYAGPEGHR